MQWRGLKVCLGCKYTTLSYLNTSWGEESWEFRACEMFGYLFSSYLYPPCALLFIAIPVQRWHDLWNLQGNVQRLRSHRGLQVLQIKHPNLSHYLALFTLEVQRCLKIRKTAPISDVWPIFWRHNVKINLFSTLNIFGLSSNMNDHPLWNTGKGDGGVVLPNQTNIKSYVP